METAQVFVLAVDDDAILRDFMANALSDGGYTVLQAESAEEADRLLLQHKGMLGGLVTDIQLAKNARSGWDIAQKAREIDPALPVVYVTGNNADEWPSRGVPHSVLLQKPYTPADLISAIAGLRKTE